MPDSVERRDPECLAWMDSTIFFKAAPTLDLWFFENALGCPAEKKVDWDEDSKSDAATIRALLSPSDKDGIILVKYVGICHTLQ